MRRKTFPYFVLIGIALILLFLVSCGSQDNGVTVTGSSDPSGISAGSRSDLGGFIENSIQITSADDDQSTPATAYDIGRNVFFTVWADARDQGTLGKDIYGAFVNAFDGTLMSEIAISNTTGNQIQPDVAFDWQSKRHLVVFTNSVDKHIYGQFINATTYDLTDMGSNFAISHDVTTMTRYIPYDGGRIEHASSPGNFNIGVGDSSTQIFTNTVAMAAPVPAYINAPYSSGVANVTNQTSIYPYFVTIYEGNSIVGWDDGFGVIDGQRGGTSYTGVAVGTGDGATYTFTPASNLNTPVSTGLVNIRYQGALIATDDSLGAFTSIGTNVPPIDTANSSVNYTNGALTVSFVQSTTREQIAAGTGASVGPFAGTLTNATISTATAQVFINNGVYVGVDDGVGGFTTVGGVIDIGASSIDYANGNVILQFSIGNAPQAFPIELSYSTDAPSVADAITVDYTVSGVTGLFADTSSVDYESGSIFLVYNSAFSPPASGVIINATYNYAQNFESREPSSWSFLSQQSPDAVYNEIDDTFHVAWLDTTNITSNRYYFEPAIITGDICGLNARNALIEPSLYDDSIDDSSHFFLERILWWRTNDTKMVRYRNVNLADMKNGDGDDGSGVSYDFSSALYSQGYDLDGDGTPDDLDGDPATAITDNSPIDTAVVDASHYRYTTFGTNEDCQSTTHTYSLSYELIEYENESSPRITYNPVDGTPIVAWSGSSTELTFLRDKERKFNSGTGIWDTWTITDSDTETADTKEKIVVGTEEFGIWSDQVLEVSGNVSESHPDLATDIYKNRLLVAWESQNSDSAIGKEIYGQLLNLESFVTYGSLLPISTEQYDQAAPRTSFDSVNERFMVVWEDARNTSVNLSNMDVFGQFVDPQGQLSGNNFSITVNTSNQIEPSVAFGDFDRRKFLITWKDGRDPGNAEIYGQLWEFSTAPQLQITDELGNVLYDQTLRFGGVPVYSSSEIIFKIVNNGNAPLLINSVTAGNDVSITSNPLKPFNLTTTTPDSVNPGSEFEIAVKFAPTIANTYSGIDSSILITSNGGISRVYFSGYGVGENPVIVTSALPDGALYNSYTTTFEGSGGTKPYSWALTAGKISNGLTLDGDDGIITGIPNAAGTENFTLQLIDAAQKTTSANLSITILDMAIVTAVLPDASKDVAYSETISVAGGTAPYTWIKFSGSLPTGISIIDNTVTAGTDYTLSGTPTDDPGTFTFTIQVTDSSGTPKVTSKQLSLTVSSVVLITSTSPLPSAVLNEAYSQTVQKSGGTKPYVWTLESGAFPPGLTIDANSGIIYGTPTQEGTYSANIRLTDDNGVTTTKVLDISVGDLNITTASISDGSLNDYYETTIQASGGTSPYTWSYIGNLPPGILLNSSIGTSAFFNGVPTSIGSYSFLVNAADSASPQLTVQKIFNIDITNLVINTTTLSDGAQDINYAQLLDANGGTEIYTWRVIAGKLPSGLSINADTGYISGTPISVGTSTFIVEVEDSDNAVATRKLTITISDLNIITEDPLTPASEGEYYAEFLEVEGGTSPYIWSYTGTLPATVAFNSNGLINGTPSVGDKGNYKITAFVNDNTGLRVSKEFSFTVYDIRITTASLSAGVVTLAYSQILEASGGDGIYTWTIDAGVLPLGLNIDSASGYISGTPSTQGKTTFRVKVVDASSNVATQIFSITISDLNITTESPITPASEGVYYAEFLTVEGGSSPYSWWYTGTLPATMAFNSNGLINGSPSAGDKGNYKITAFVNDITGLEVNKELSFTVYDISIDPTPLSDGAKAIAYADQLVAAGGDSIYTWSIVAGVLPSGLSLDAASGYISGTPTIEGTSTFRVQVNDASGAVASQIKSITISDLSITTGSPLSPASENVYYSEFLAVEGGTSPYSWWYTGTLPATMAFNSNGLINGTPAINDKGNYKITAFVNDTTGLEVNKELSFTVYDISIDPSALSAGVIGFAYSQSLIASGGDSIYTWSIDAGVLPSGLSLDAASGYISGTPSIEGTSTFRVKVTDSNLAVATQVKSITISDLNITTSSPITPASEGVYYSEFLEVEGGTSPYSWWYTGTLPATMAFNSNGLINGTPAAGDEGNYKITAFVNDSTGLEVNKELSFTVYDIRITTQSLSAGVIGLNYSQGLIASGGDQIYSWSIDAGVLPAGLTLDSASGYISGTPSTQGKTTFRIKVADSSDAIATQIFSITISDLNITTESPITPASEGVYYAEFLEVEGGSSPYSWWYTGTLPATMAFNSNGLINGTPSAGDEGNYKITAFVNDSTGLEVNKELSFTVYDIRITTQSLSAGVIGLNYSQGLIASGGDSIYTWSIDAGVLPAGLTLDPASGYISGTPSTEGKTTFKVKVTDSSDAIATQIFSITISDLNITSESPITPASESVYYSEFLEVEGGTSPYSWWYTGTLPATMAFNSNGLINGTPAAGDEGNYKITAFVNDSTGLEVNKELSFTVYDIRITTQSLSAGVIGLNYSQGLIASGGDSIYTWSIDAGVLPAGLTLDAASGYISGIPTIEGKTTFRIKVTDSSDAIATQIFSITISDLNITTESPITPASESVYYSEFLEVEGGTSPYSWWYIGTLPATMAFNSNGLINGTPSAGDEGNYKITAFVNDSTGLEVNKELSFTVYDIRITTQSLSAGVIGLVYSQGLAATGGDQIYSWSVDAGVLPAGLTLDAASGYISGTPSIEGKTTFRVKVSDASGAIATQVFSITISDLNITTESPITPASEGVYYSEFLEVEGGSSPYSWWYTGTLPATMAFNANGLINGTPSAGDEGNYKITAFVNDNTGLEVNKELSFTVYDISIDPSALSDGAKGIAYADQLVAAGGDSIYTWSIVAGVLPSGLTLDAASGYVSGTPTIEGTSTFRVKVTDSSLAVASQIKSITISDLSIITESPLTPASESVYYSEFLAVEGGSSPYSWWYTGTLPATMAFNSNGLINGTPAINDKGNYKITAFVNDTTGLEVNKELSFTVYDISIDQSALSAGVIGLNYSQSLIASGGDSIYTWSLVAGVLPSGLSLDAASGYVSGTPTIEGTSTFRIKVTDSTGAVASQIKSITISDLNITSESPITPASETVYYSEFLEVEGGSSPYSWWYTGTLPATMTFNSNGLINGTPASGDEGNYKITAFVNDSTGLEVNKELSFTVYDIRITNPPLSAGVIGLVYSQGLLASGGDEIYTWSIDAGVLPDGLALDSASGYISGTPSTQGKTTFRVKVNDASGAIATQVFSITISDLNITSESPITPASEGVYYNEFLEVVGGSSPYSWWYTGTLPATMAFNSNGLINGTPALGDEGNYKITAFVNDNTGLEVNKELSFTVYDISIDPTPLSDGAKGIAYADQLVAAGGDSIYSWSIVAGVLPAGLSLDAASGYVSGTPTIEGTSTFRVKVQDASGAVASQVKSITISDLSITTESPLSPASEAVYYSEFLAVEGGSSPYSWWYTGTLPATMAFNSNGLINGSPAVGDKGNYKITAFVNDTTGLEVNKELSFTVYDISIDPSALSAGVIGLNYSQSLLASGGDSIYSWSVVAGVLPAGLSLDAASGYISGTPTIEGTSTFRVKVVDASGAVATLVKSITISDLNITTESPITPASESVYYAEFLEVEGGTSPYSWWYTGNLPATMAFNANGLINGTPAAGDEGNYKITAFVNDSTGLEVNKELSLTVYDVRIDPSSLSAGVIDFAYSQLLLASGGDEIYTWSIDAGVLPNGLTLDSASGYISGTPTTEGKITFRVKVVDSSGAVNTQVKSITISDLNITTDSPITPASEGVYYAEFLSVEGGTSPYSWWYTGNLPATMAFNSNGLINGTPGIGDEGNYKFTAFVNDSTGLEVNKELSLTVYDISIDATALSAGARGIAYADQLVANGGDLIYTWSIVAGALPVGLTLDAATGYISGTPSAEGTSTFRVQVNDASGAVNTQVKSITISDLNITSESPITPASEGVFYSEFLEVEGGSAPYSWWYTGNLPASMILNAGGLLNGTPAIGDKGGYKITAFVNDSTGLEVNKELTLTVYDISIDATALSDGAKGIAYADQLVAYGGDKIYIWSIDAGVLPLGLRLDPATGYISGKPTIEGTSTFRVKVEDASGAVNTQIKSITISDLNIITESSLVPASEGVYYSEFLEVEGGSSPYSWWYTGTLPATMAFNSNGLINGTPALGDEGNYKITAFVNDSTGLEVNKELTLTVYDISIDPTSLSDGAKGIAYADQLVAYGGDSIYTWSIDAGLLPAGLLLDAASGYISGIPTIEGTSTFRVKVEDASFAVAIQVKSITISDLNITSESPMTPASESVYYAEFLAVEGGTSPYSWWYTGTLPATMAFNSNGLVNGTPAVGDEGSYKITAFVNDSTGLEVNKEFKLTVYDISIDPTALSDGARFIAYADQLVAYGGDSIYTWSIDAGVLPAGLALDPASGYISGTPNTQGTSTFRVKVTDSLNAVATQIKSITISDMDITTDETLPPGAESQIYSEAIEVEGGTSPYTWTKSGTLPTGMNFLGDINATAIVNGTPAAGTKGNYKITVTVEDANNLTVKKEFTLQISLLSITTTLLDDGIVANQYSQLLQGLGGSGVYFWTIESGFLNPGLKYDPGTGNIYGIPSREGTSTFVVRLDDLVTGEVAKKILSITISDPSSSNLSFVTPHSLGSAIINTPFSKSIDVVGGQAPYTWGYAGTLPAGLTLINTVDESQYILSGTADINEPKGFYQIRVTVTDALGISATRDFELRLVDLSITTLSLTNGEVTKHYTQELQAAGGSGIYSWKLIAGRLPIDISSGAFIVYLSLDAFSGNISGIPKVGGTSTFIVEVTDEVTGIAVSKGFTIRVEDPSSGSILLINDEDLGAAVWGDPYFLAFDVLGGQTPYTWHQVSGVMPTGLTFNNTPVSPAYQAWIDGTPSGVMGYYGFRIRVSDVNGEQTEKDFTLRVVDLSIINTPLSAGALGVDYSDNLVGAGGNGIYTWTIAEGSLPDGLTINENTGYISGTPSAIGTWYFYVKLEDSTLLSVTRKFSITIGTMNITTDSPLPPGSVNAAYSEQLNVTGGKSPYTWYYPSENLPASLSNNSSGLISGTPIAGDAGDYSISVIVNDTDGVSVNKDFSLSIYDLTITSTPPLDAATIDVPYSYQMTSTGGSGIYRWSVAAGALPTGLTIDENSGVIAGTASAQGTYTFMLRLEDAMDLVPGVGPYALGLYDITVSDLQIVTSTEDLPLATLGGTYDVNFTGNGGVGTYAWAVNNPAELTNFGFVLTAAGNLYSANIIKSGNMNLTVTLTDTDTPPTTVTKTIAVSVTILSIETSTLVDILPTAVAGTPYESFLIPLSGTPPYLWSKASIADVVNPGNLPDGLSIHATTGRISGTPSDGAVGNNYVTIELKDGIGNVARRTIMIPVIAAVAGGGAAAGSGSGEEAGGTACYVATAAYGSYLDGNVKVLRDFRDNVLLKSSAGRVLVDAYYATSPPIADFIAQHPALRVATRAILTPVIYTVKAPLLGFALIFGAASALLVSRRRRRR